MRGSGSGKRNEDDNEGLFTAPLELWQDCTRAGTVCVGTSDENESGGAFATRRTVTISIQNGLHKYYIYNHMYRVSTCLSPYQPYLNR